MSTTTAESQAPRCPAGREIATYNGNNNLATHTDDGTPCLADASCWKDDVWRCGLGRELCPCSRDPLHHIGPDNGVGPCHGSACPDVLRAEDVAERRRIIPPSSELCTKCGRPVVKTIAAVPDGPQYETGKRHHDSMYLPPDFDDDRDMAADEDCALLDKRHRDLGPPKAQQRKAREPERRDVKQPKTFGGTVRRPVDGSELTAWQKDRRMAEQDRRAKAPLGSEAQEKSLGELWRDIRKNMTWADKLNGVTINLQTLIEDADIVTGDELKLIHRRMISSDALDTLSAAWQEIADTIERLTRERDDAVARAEKAEAWTRRLLMAGTHVANDHNCEEWPPGHPCNGCEGDDVRCAVYEEAREAGILED